MAETVAIPVWVLLLAWAVGGLLIGSPWINSKSARMTFVRPTARERLQLALGIVASGPIACGAVAWAFIADALATLRRKFAKPAGEQKGGGEG